MTTRWIDPEIAEFLDGLPPVVGELTDERLPELRRVREEALALMELSDAVERSDHVVPGPEGEPEIVVRVHRPVGAGLPSACVYSIHGGGFVIGSARMEDLRLEQICLEVGCMAASVEYRLSPETAYPGPLEDCYAGLAWLHAHADELGVDPARIGVSGTSAGGGLAAALCLLARDRGGPPIAFQLLAYPMLDDRAATPSSRWQVPVWDPQNNEYGWRAYLGPRYGTPDVPPTAAPARALDLTGLPPAYVFVGSADLFLDEDVAYTQALHHAGVPAELHVYAGGVHGFDGVAGHTALARRAREAATEWLRRVSAP